MSNPADTKLSNDHIMFLVRILTGNPEERKAPTKSDAIEAFKKAIRGRIGDRLAGLCWKVILNQENAIAAHHLVGNIIEKFDAKDIDAIPIILEEASKPPTGDLQPQGEPKMTSEALTTDKPVADAPVKQKKEKKEKAPKAEGENRRGRVAKLEGKKLTALKDDDGRSDRNKGKTSFLIIKNNPGITFEEFIAQGGRNADALWDIKNGVIKAE